MGSPSTLLWLQLPQQQSRGPLGLASPEGKCHSSRLRILAKVPNCREVARTRHQAATLSLQPGPPSSCFLQYLCFPLQIGHNKTHLMEQPVGEAIKSMETEFIFRLCCFDSRVTPGS